MDQIRTASQQDRLRKRRAQVVMTLGHLRNEKAEVARNTDWLDRTAYESRVRLLDRLTHWYLAEIKELDRALARAAGAFGSPANRPAGRPSPSQSEHRR